MPGLAVISRINDVGSNVEKLARAVSGVVARACAAREGIQTHQLYDDAPWPSPPARARAAAIYLIRVELDFSVEDAAALTGAGDRRAVSRAIRRIEEARETDQGLDHWLADMERALRGEAL